MATISDVLTITRHLLQDTRAPYRHTDAKLINYFNMGLAEARRIRPDLFLPDIYDTTFAYTDLDGAATFPLSYGYEMAFIEYIAGYTSLEEDEFVSDGRAAALLSRFTQKMVGGQG